MKKTIVWVLCLLLALSACAEGILPVLKTPAPEVSEAVAPHNLLGETKDASGSTSDGGYYYEYRYTSETNYPFYERYGKALAQEGFTRSSYEISESGVVTAAVSNGPYSIEIEYSQDQSLKVTYSPHLMARTLEKGVCYEVDETQTSILPELKQAISIHAVTASYTTLSKSTAEGGRKYTYYPVTYACYERFSEALAADGYTLVSSEMLEDGFSRAVVDNGETELTIDYNPETQYAYVTYPPLTFPRWENQYDDFVTVADGDVLELSEGITLTVLGWEKVDSYTSYYYSDNWIPSKYCENVYTTGDGIQQILLRMKVENGTPEQISREDILTKRYVRFGSASSTDLASGTETSENKLYTQFGINVNAEATVLIGFGLTEQQMANLDKVAFTFTGKNMATKYVYFLQTPAD